ncbi:hypothetical protein [Rhodopseudomonas faecalis]|uniref:hypothetical protein n=1 Tax=Rhodopseudomonas faecalis TaxID=99655 RepID=UPI0015E89230|nr:hypothetical protein [Rhodopseudomonas faecalis]
MTSVETILREQGGQDRGPLWRRSAFRPAMAGRRYFALRGFLRVVRLMGRAAPNEFAKPLWLRANKGEGEDADDQPADR